MQPGLMEGGAGMSQRGRQCFEQGALVSEMLFSHPSSSPIAQIETVLPKFCTTV